ncbi:MAG: type VI secretion system baseplate subunit TssK, partial [Zoogloeaceae bacterium]|nr:type VI secretion system baseplate subunit TssK [Zoogloeaceae bacterium]
MSWNSKVIWSEGLFLQPQHLQQADRHTQRLVEGRVGPMAAHAWGFTHLEWDTAALAMGKLVLTVARGILPDGTPFDFPAQDAPPLPFEPEANVKDATIVLAVPLQRAGGLDVDLESADATRLTRYVPDELDVPDATLASQRTALVQIGHLNARLMLARDATDAWATLGAARIVERRSDNQLVLDKQFVPPTLDVAANPILAGYLKEIIGLVHQRGEALAARLGQPGRGGVGEIADFLLLQTTNRFEPVFQHLGNLAGAHPERLYATALMLAGDLATFSRENRRPVAYPVYHHDDPQACFLPLMADLRRSLSMVLEQTAIPIDLMERKFGVRVAIVPDAELLRSAAFVLAVNAQIPSEAVRQRFPNQVKIGPVEKIRDLVNLALPGIALRNLPVAPRQLPYHAGFNYFELDRGSELWKQLQQSGGLAMHIAGDFPGLELELWAIRA